MYEHVLEIKVVIYLVAIHFNIILWKNKIWEFKLFSFFRKIMLRHRCKGVTSKCHSSIMSFWHRKARKHHVRAGPWAYSAIFYHGHTDRRSSLHAIRPDKGACKLYVTKFCISFIAICVHLSWIGDFITNHLGYTPLITWHAIPTRLIPFVLTYDTTGKGYSANFMMTADVANKDCNSDETKIKKTYTMIEKLC